MKTSDFFFDLPEHLIAKYPPPKRGASRLMLLNRKTGNRQHCMVSDLSEILSGPDFRNSKGQAPLLVFNNSRVRKARLKASLKALSVTAGAVSREAEFLLLKRIDSHTWQTMVNRAKRRRIGSRYCFEGGIEGEIVDSSLKEKDNFGGEEFRYVRFDSPIDDNWLDMYGHVPLPPYLKRVDESSDSDRYQTVYADRRAGVNLGPGASAAAPTAGLHFTDELFAQFDRAGIEKVFITLHVGLGTFLPVRTEHIEEHLMHEEVYNISEEAAGKINAAKTAGRIIIAVGTTAVRTLESACNDGRIKAGEGTTSIFIYPGYRFKMVDALFTNFHTPGSTLLMLVSAFANANAGAFAEGNAGAFTGRQLILESYAEAIREKYRFFSYGDAMLIW